MSGVSTPFTGLGALIETEEVLSEPSKLLEMASVVEPSFIVDLVAFEDCDALELGMDDVDVDIDSEEPFFTKPGRELESLRSS
jgi:hypothetical protein